MNKNTVNTSTPENNQTDNVIISYRKNDIETVITHLNNVAFRGIDQLVVVTELLNLLLHGAYVPQDTQPAPKEK